MKTSCHKALLWLQARESLWSNLKWTQSRFFQCKKYELLLRLLRSNYFQAVSYLRSILCMCVVIVVILCVCRTLLEPRGTRLWVQCTTGVQRLPSFAMVRIKINHKISCSDVVLLVHGTHCSCIYFWVLINFWDCDTNHQSIHRAHADVFWPLGWGCIPYIKRWDPCLEFDVLTPKWYNLQEWVTDKYYEEFALDNFLLESNSTLVRISLGFLWNGRCIVSMRYILGVQCRT